MQVLDKNRKRIQCFKKATTVGMKGLKHSPFITIGNGL